MQANWQPKKLTEAILNALRERLDREKRVERPNDLVVALREAKARIARLPVYDDRSADEILGYRGNGLPGEKWDSEREQ